MSTTRLFGRSLALVLGLGAVLATATPASAAVWVPGHFTLGGAWVPGHWRPGGPRIFVAAPPAVVVAPHRVWVPGHWGFGWWHPGHWVIAP
jgi:hypothetical protein